MLPPTLNSINRKLFFVNLDRKFGSNESNERASVIGIIEKPNNWNKYILASSSLFNLLRVVAYMID